MSAPLRWFCTATAALVLTLPAPAQGQWAGTIQTREISFHIDLFRDLVGDNPETLLDLPLGDLLAGENRPDAAEYDFEVTQSELRISGTRIRTNIEEGMAPGMGGGYGIIDIADGMMYMVVPPQKMIMEMNVAEISEMIEAMAEGGMDEADAPDMLEVTPLPGSRTINGRTCRGYRTEESDGTVTIAWVSDDDAELHELFREFAELVGQMDEDGEPDADLSLAPYGFPILSYTFSADGTVNVEETLSITREAVADEVFALPADYQRMNMAQMMQMQMEQMQRKN